MLQVCDLPSPEERTSQFILQKLGVTPSTGQCGRINFLPEILRNKTEPSTGLLVYHPKLQVSVSSHSPVPDYIGFVFGATPSRAQESLWLCTHKLLLLMTEPSLGACKANICLTVLSLWPFPLFPVRYGGLYVVMIVQAFCVQQNFLLSEIGGCNLLPLKASERPDLVLFWGWEFGPSLVMSLLCSGESLWGAGD